MVSDKEEILERANKIFETFEMKEVLTDTFSFELARECFCHGFYTYYVYKKMGGIIDENNQ